MSIIKTTVRFELHVSRTNKDGKAPIRLIYQFQGQRKFYPTKLKCLPVNWNAREQKAVYFNKKAAKNLVPKIDCELLLTEREVNNFNDDLSRYKNDIRNVEERFKLDGITFSLAMVLETLAAKKIPEIKKEDPGKSIIAFIKQFIEDSKATHKAGTLKVYSGLAAHLTAFQKHTGRKATFEKIDIPLLRAFHSFLSQSRTIVIGDGVAESKPMNNITSAKQMSTLKTLLNYARTIYKINVHPDYRDYKVARKDSDFEVITLTYDEFETLLNLDLTNNKRLAQVRDVFCFSCATGLRYSDLSQLRREHIRSNAIKMTASKTGQRLEIPLNIFSASILKKYEGMLRPLPIISNQKTNDYLKELCKEAEINTPIEIIREYGITKKAVVYKKHELISIHTARKTFVTLSLEKGIAAQDVMALSGHATFKSFKRYVDITSKRKQAVMAEAWGKVPNTNLKAV